MFCIICASFWFSGFLGLLSGVSWPLSALVYLFHAVHFYHLSYSPLGSFPRLSSSSTPFRVFFCLPWLPGGFALALLSFHQFISVFPLPLSLLLVRLLALGAFVLLLFRLFPTLFLAVPVEPLRFRLLFIILSRLLISHLSLFILFMAPRPLCLGSSLFVVAFPPDLPPWWSPSHFLCLGTRFSFPLSFFRLGVCARLWCHTLSYYLLALPRPPRWFSLFVAYLYAVHDPLAGGHAFLSYWLLAHSGELGQFSVWISNFSIVSSSLSDLLLLCRISLVSFPGSLGPSVCPYTWAFPSLVPPHFTLTVVGWSSPMALLLQVSPSSTASACHCRLLLSFFPFPSSFGCSSFSVLSTPYVFGVIFPSLHGFLLLGFLLFISLG